MGDPKHNTIGGIAAEQLCAYINRIENIEGDIRSSNDDKRDIYAEAKALGFCKKTMRKLIKRRMKDESRREEEDALLELYEAAMASLTNKDPLEY